MEEGLGPEQERGKGRCLRQGEGLGEGGAPEDDNPEVRRLGDWGGAAQSRAGSLGEKGKEDGRSEDGCCGPGQRG